MATAQNAGAPISEGGLLTDASWPCVVTMTGGNFLLKEDPPHPPTPAKNFMSTTFLFFTPHTQCSRTSNFLVNHNPT